MVRLTSEAWDQPQSIFDLLFCVRVCVLCHSASASLKPHGLWPGSLIHGISQARVLEQVAISSSRGSSRPRDRTHVSCVSCLGRHILYCPSPLGSRLCSRVDVNLSAFSQISASLCDCSLGPLNLL